jgi:hypothetical protein
MIANELVRRGAIVCFQTRDPLSVVESLLSPKVTIIRRFNLVRLVKRPGGVDVDATVELFADYRERLESWTREISTSPEVEQADIIVSDTVEEAGILAEMFGVPVVLVTNFTWHWALSKIDERLIPVARQMETGFTKARELLYPPLSIESEASLRRTAVPLISRKRRDPFSVREELGIDAGQPILVISDDGTDGLDSIDFHFVSKPWTVIRRWGTPRGDSTAIKSFSQFRDYMNVADLVISHGGYSSLAETLADGVRHLIVEEENHPESQASAKLAENARRAVRCSWAEFVEDPNGWVEVTLAADLNLDPVPTYGAEVVASRILELASAH